MQRFSSFLSTVYPPSVRRWVGNQKVLVDANDTPIGMQSTASGANGIWGPTYLTAGQIASPTAAMISDLYARYQLNVAPYTSYRSDGTTLQMMPSTGDTPTFAGLNTRAGATTALIAAAFFNILAPESLASTVGLGTTTTPFTNADNTAGIQSAITAFNGGGGEVQFSAASYSGSGTVNITTPAIALRSVARAWNIDPDGLTFGSTGSQYLGPTGAAAFNIGNASTRVGGFTSDDMYVYGSASTVTYPVGGPITDGSAGYLFSGAGGGTDQPQFFRGLISHFQYGIQVQAQIDAGLILGTSLLGNGYGIYANTASNGFIFSNVVAAQISDNSNNGVYDGSASGALQIAHSVLVRNAGTSGTNPHPANVYFTSSGSALLSSLLDQPGVSFANSTQVAADNIIVDGTYMRVLDNYFVRAADGNHIHLTGSAQYNLIANNLFSTVSGACLLLDSGASENGFSSMVPCSVTDNSGANNYLDYVYNGGAAGLNYRVYQSAATPIFKFKSNGSALYGTFVGLDATSVTGGKEYRLASTAGSAGEGQGWFSIIDQTDGGADRFMIGPLGQIICPYGSVTIGAVGQPTITSGAGAPSSTQPNGSIYLRNNGAANTRIYVSEGSGTWAAISSS